MNGRHGGASPRTEPGLQADWSLRFSSRAQSIDDLMLTLVSGAERAHDSSMAKWVKIRIRGSGLDSDAPTVEDLFDQLRDYFELLEEVEQNVAVDGQTAIQWRVTHAVTASPIVFTVQAFPKQFAVNVDARASQVLVTTLDGCSELLATPTRPRDFSDKALHIAQKFYNRLTDGLDEAEIQVEDLERPLIIRPSAARKACENVREILSPVENPYQEYGSIEGHLKRVGQEGRGRKVVHVRLRTTGDEVKCFVTGEAEKQVAQCEVGEIWRSSRVEILGLIHYRGPHRISYVEADRLHWFPAESELPRLSDLIDENFTGGLLSEDHLDRLRDGHG